MSSNMQWPQSGLGSVGAYQMGGIPYASASINVPASGSSAKVVEFPYVVKFVTVINMTSGSTNPIRVGFSAAGVSGSNYFVLNGGDSYTGEWRIEDLYLRSDNGLESSASIIAGLTPIPRGVPSFVLSGNVMIGNNWSGSVGVG